MHLLFVCTGNSCRSQMAEGFARRLAGPDITVESAGLEAHGQNPRALAVMDEIGVPIDEQASTQLTDAMLGEADVVVTVCGHADEHCPLLPPGTRKGHWPIDDPARAIGSEAEITTEFRRVRDEIHERVAGLLNGLRNEMTSANESVN